MTSSDSTQTMKWIIRPLGVELLKRQDNLNAIARNYYFTELNKIFFKREQEPGMF